MSVKAWIGAIMIFCAGYFSPIIIACYKVYGLDIHTLLSLNCFILLCGFGMNLFFAGIQEKV